MSSLSNVRRTFRWTLALEGFATRSHSSDIDVVVYSDEYPTVLGKEAGTPEDMAIAEYAAAFIHSGCTLQTGIGAVPNLVAEALVKRDGGDYGVHSEMFTDGLYQLCASGKVTNERKPIHRGDSVITFALGSQEMYDFLNENEKVRLAPVAYVNDPSVIAKNHRMVSVNSALEVDLQGQIVADTSELVSSRA